MLKGIGQQMKWSVRDESLHSKMGCQLFRDMCAEDDTYLSYVEKTLLKLQKLW
jgi:ribonucleoside-diphosphate reductase beta chain